MMNFQDRKKLFLLKHYFSDFISILNSGCPALGKCVKSGICTNNFFDTCRIFFCAIGDFKYIGT